MTMVVMYNKIPETIKYKICHIAENLAALENAL